jgi:molecular chaperone DnaK (HSP70)
LGEYFDISILELGMRGFEVKSTNGDTHLAVMILTTKLLTGWLKNSLRKKELTEERPYGPAKT